ncbi:MAG: two-component sensor histidine kinase [Campylobacterales bacterium]|nr:two-component sensor histidine kinase [Campylobacterales bacterium]
MIDEKLLKSLNPHEKEELKKSLENLIEQTFIIEKEYKELNGSYQQLQNLISSIIEVLPNAIWVVDEVGEIFLQNSEAKNLSHIFNLINFELLEDELEYQNRYFLIKTSKTGDKKIISLTDISEQKRKERLVSMGQMAAHLAHEIRNPIGSVALLTSTLLSKADIKLKPLLVEIKKSIWRVERIVKATLLFSKGLNLNKEPFFIDSIVEELESAINYYTYTKEIEFKFKLPHEKMVADFDLMVMVFQNFIFNAIDAIEDDELESGVVEIDYSFDKDCHIFTIYDSGVPILNSEILFQPFKTTKTKGNGLGLSLSLQIISAHGGEITLSKVKKGFEIKIQK